MNNMEKALTKLKEVIIEIEKEWQKLSYDEHWELNVKYPYNHSHDIMAEKILQWVDEHTIKKHLEKGVKNKVRKVISFELNVSYKDVKPWDTLRDLGADSLDLVNIVMELEKEFEINIKDDEAYDLERVCDIVNLVTNKCME